MTRPIDIHTLVAASPRILVLLWGVTLPFCAFTGWLFLYLADQNAPVSAGVLAALFLLIGGTLLAGTIELTLHYLRYDALCLTLTGEPPAVGRRLDAVVELPARAAAAWVGVELACVQVTRERIGAHRTATFEKDCWSEKRQFPVRRIGRQASAVVGFDIPEALPPTGTAGAPAAAESAREQYAWELRVEPSGADPALKRTLDVHVLPPPGSGARADPQAH